MSRPVSIICRRCNAASLIDQGSLMGRPAFWLRFTKSGCLSAMTFSRRSSPEASRNFTSTVSLWRIEMAVCSHRRLTSQVRPRGSGPA